MQMRKGIGKIFMGLTALVVMFAIAPLTAKAEIQTGSVDGVTEGEITWSYDTEMKVVTVTGTGTRIQPETEIDWWGYQSPFPLEAEKVQFINCNVEGNLSSLFGGMGELQSIDFTGLITSNITDMNDMFSRCYKLINVDVSNFDTSDVTDMNGMFSFCRSLTSLDLSGFDTGNVKDMGDMFLSCNKLKELNLGSFNTINVANMYGMFEDCGCLESLDVSGFDTSNVTRMGHMFFGCKSLTSLDVSRFNTGKVTYMGWMFGLCDSLTSLDVSRFNTSLVTNMEWMFYKCSSLTSLDVSDFDTSSVTDMCVMFSECCSLEKLDVSKFDTSNVTDMGSMFKGCSNLASLDVSRFDTSNVTNVGAMFLGCSSLTSLDLSNFSLSNIGVGLDQYTDGDGAVLDDCTKLQTIKTPQTMGTARIDLPGTYQYGEQTTTYVAKDYFAGVELHKVVEGTPTATPKPTATPTATPKPTATPTATPKPTATPTATPTPTPTPEAPPTPPTQTEQQEQMVEDFVSHMYEVALGREADEGGLNYWKDRLVSGEIDGAGIADGFMKSQELKDKNLDDGAYLDTLYEAFFGRIADEGGKNDWLKRMSEGMSREQVLAGFSNSEEFGNLCDDFGIAQGILKDDGVPINAGIVSFVERIYTKALGRESDRGGLTDWAGQIDRREKQPVEVAKQFFFSEEYTNHGYDDGEFVETLYLTFMGRESDEGGKNHWINKLTTEGWTREQVLDSFASSEEFSNIMKGFGL